MSALPDKGTSLIFKRALLRFLTEPPEVGQLWNLHCREDHWAGYINDYGTRIRIEEINSQYDRVHFVRFDNDSWGWFTSAEFTRRRLDGSLSRVL